MRACVCVLHTSVEFILADTYLMPIDSDLKTDGFSVESCRSMVAVMDVSFSRQHANTHGVYSILTHNNAFSTLIYCWHQTARLNSYVCVIIIVPV